ncbi:hypothetical protein VTL71DRAFT_6934 [Oculimacula yallundae]|uniref:Uncharacterized protein n=1 Tax=Oculimacula yallundae TaxID=86028 RepID=A0ABR4BVA8_9HELO
MRLIAMVAFAACTLAVPTQIDITIITDGPMHSSYVGNGEKLLTLAHNHHNKEKCMPEWKIPDEDKNHWLCHLGWDIGKPHPCCDPNTTCQKLPYPPVEEGYGWGCLPKASDEDELREPRFDLI